VGYRVAEHGTDVPVDLRCVLQFDRYVNYSTSGDIKKSVYIYYRNHNQSSQSRHHQNYVILVQIVKLVYSVCVFGNDIKRFLTYACLKIGEKISLSRLSIYLDMINERIY